MFTFRLGQLLTVSAKDQVFDLECFITATPLTPTQTLDEALEHAIEVAANDVTEEVEDDQKVFRVSKIFQLL